MTVVALIASSASAAAANDVHFDDFSSTGLLYLGIEAIQTETSDGWVLRLTAAPDGEPPEFPVGTAFWQLPLDICTFRTTFSFRVSDDGGAPVPPCSLSPGADGLVFVVQGVGFTAFGSDGGNIGFGTLPSSVGVEFDAWCNAANHDPNESHCGIVAEGIVDHGFGAPFTAPVKPDLGSDIVFHSWVEYDGTTLRVFLSLADKQPATPIVERPVDIPSIVDGSTAHVGFTSATGGAWSNHDVLSWSFTSHCRGDITSDGNVGFADLLWLLSNWMGATSCKSNLDGDGVVGFGDLLELLSVWGRCH